MMTNKSSWLGVSDDAVWFPPCPVSQCHGGLHPNMPPGRRVVRLPGAAAAADRHGPRAIRLPGAANHADRAVRRRRTHRHRGASDAGWHVASPRAADRDRERDRRRRHHRGDSHHAGGARRLYDHAWPYGHACRRGRALSETAVQPGRRFRADRARAADADAGCRQEVVPGPRSAGVHRLRRPAPHGVDHGPCRHGIGVVCHLRTVQRA